MPDPNPDAELFIALLARNERLLGSYVLTMVPNPSDADDILQESKVVMWRAFHQFVPDTNFTAWARKICFHQVLAFRKRRYRDRLDFSDAFLEAVAREIEQKAEYLEKREHALQSCLAKLSKSHLEVLSLRYFDGLSIDEMSDRLNRTTTALYRLLSRIRESLHNCITNTLAESALDES
jgi:RNA polymerase sigma-70 factor (ECF subfamily)